MPQEQLHLLKSILSETGTEFELTIKPPETIEFVESLFCNTDICALFDHLEHDPSLRQLLLTHKDILTKNLFQIENPEDDDEDDVIGKAMTNILRTMLVPFLFCVERGKGKNDEPTFCDLREQSEKKLQFKVPIRWVDDTLTHYADRLVENVGDKVELIEADTNKTDEEKGMALMSLVISTMFKPLTDDKQIIKTTNKAIQRHITDHIPDIANFLFNEIKSGLFSVVEKNSQFLLKSLPIPEDKYLKALEVLCFKTKTITPFVSLQWCDSPAHPELPYSFYLFGHSRVPKSKCPICNKSLAHATVYTFKSSIASLLRQQDGMLPYFIMWLLEKRGYHWSPNTYLKGEGDDTEKDIIFKHKTEVSYSLIECKTFMGDRESVDVTVRRIENNGLNSLVKYVKTYGSKGIPIKQLFLFTNLEVTPEIQERIKKSIAKQKQYKRLRDRDVILLGSTDFERFYQYLARPPRGEQ